jgi:mannose-6-phosphate isomerase
LGTNEKTLFLMISFAKKRRRMQKEQIFEKTLQKLSDKGYKIVKHDFDRPWGGFFVIEEEQTQKFAAEFFSDFELSALQITQKLSPKILVVAPEKRLSWQYHDRRAEIWRVIEGTVGIKTSQTDTEGPVQSYPVGSLIKLQQGERHRLIGLDNWGIVAEIWQHTNAQHPSDEDDIYRLQDDFGR